MVKATRSSSARGIEAAKADAKADAAPAATRSPRVAKSAAAAPVVVGTKASASKIAGGKAAGGKAIDARTSGRKSVGRKSGEAKATGARTTDAGTKAAKTAGANAKGTGPAARRTPAKASARGAAATTRSAKQATRDVATKSIRGGAAAGRGRSALRSKVAAGESAAAAQCSPVQLGYLSSFVGFHLRLAQDASYRAFARIKDKELVKPGRFPALAIIHLNPGISQSALGRAIARDKSTVSPLIKDLQNNGFINRKPSPSDRRSVTLSLTKKGERVLDRLHARALEHEGDLDKILGTAKNRLVSVLDKITGGLAPA